MSKTSIATLIIASICLWAVLFAGGCPSPRGYVMELTPNVLEFPPTDTGMISDQLTLTLTNITGSRFQLEQIRLPSAPFRLVQSVELPKYVDPGQSLTFKFDFAPQSIGDYQSSIRFSPDNGNEGYASLKGKGVTPGNEAPGVDIGTDLDIALSDQITLSSEVTHDGVPGGEETLTYLWEKVAGPGDALFTTHAEQNTGLRCTREGEVTIRLTVDDGELTGSDELIVNVGPSTSNLPPEIEADGPGSIYLPDYARLTGEWFDDGLPDPPGNVSFLWEVQSGPGSVVFSEQTVLRTVVWFDAPGHYVFRLTADDGELQSSDSIDLFVKEEPWNTFNLEGEIDDGLLRLSLGIQRLDWDYDAFKTQIYIGGSRLKFLHANLKPEAGLDPDLLDIHWLTDNTIELVYSGTVSADQPRPLVDLYFERGSSHLVAIAPYVSSSEFLDGDFLRTGPSYPDWDGGTTEEIQAGEIAYWFPLDDSFRLRAYQHLGGIRLIADVGELSSWQNIGDRHYRIGWDHVKLGSPELAVLKKGDWVKTLSFPSDGLLDVDWIAAEVSTKMDLTVWALDFDILPGATGEVDFTVENVDIGFDLSGGWYPALDVPLP